MQTFLSRGASASPLAGNDRLRWAFWGVVFAMAGLAASGLSAIASHEDWHLHAAWVVACVLISTMTVMESLRRGYGVLFTDHLVIFSIAFCVYFLGGALFPVLGDPEQVARASDYYPATAVDALRVDSVNSLGFGIALIAGGLAPVRSFFGLTAGATTVASIVPAKVGLVVLGSLALPASAIVIYHDLFFSETILPGVVRSMAQMSAVLILLLAAVSGRSQLRAHLLAALLAVVYATAGLLLFNKTQMLTPLAAFCAGAAFNYRKRIVWGVGILLITLLYVNTSNLVLFGRSMIYRQENMSLSWRAEILLDGIRDAYSGKGIDEASAWGRLSYLNVQAAALDFYDSGDGGDDFSKIPWVFVPRLLVPSKPIMTDVGQRFNEKILNAESQSSTGQGVFVSGYYSGGWIGVVAASALAGWILALTSVVARQVFRRDAVLIAPFGFAGMYIAFRIDGAFLADYIGMFSLILYCLLFLWLIEARLRRSVVSQRNNADDRLAALESR